MPVGSSDSGYNLSKKYLPITLPLAFTHQVTPPSFYSGRADKSPNRQMIYFDSISTTASPNPSEVAFSRMTPASYPDRITARQRPCQALRCGRV
jgi:hypothetical protein